MSSKCSTKSNVCGQGVNIIPGGCASQEASFFQCLTSTTDKAKQPTFALGKFTGLTPTSRACCGSGGISEQPPRNVCCNSSTDFPWKNTINGYGYNQQHAFCYSLPETPCPGLGFSGSLPPEGYAVCYGDSLSSRSDVNNFSNILTPTMSKSCIYPITVFEGTNPIYDPSNNSGTAALAVQMYRDTFVKDLNDGSENSETYGTKIMPYFCQQETVFPDKCPNDLITGQKMTTCSNFVVGDGDSSNPTGGNLCREWYKNSYNKDKFRTEVTGAMQTYCTSTRNQVWIDDCRCLNAGGNPNTTPPEGDPVFVGLTVQSIPASCWYIPCIPSTDLDNNQLITPLAVNAQERPGINGFCPQNVCQQITFNYEKSNLSEDNVKQSISCSETKKAASNATNNSTDIRNFAERNKAWIIGVGIGVAVLIIIIIAVVLISRSGKKTPPPNFQNELKSLES